ncbi:myelin-oligodendrocyte glycoprotein-like isoform X2 [Mugil cephalus]|uniref:myelin-oligodendrocyte glycoprotein-like isoform X2 n=1 Tax=Mugil cephalus TaxID=48193 RepID=UPI001FB64E85|nr:myelin-oligodendrocyte glycoprotein-like isoform X2 [Mugil cephalus]
MRMTRINCFVSLVTFLWMMILVRADTDVSCVVGESCILPCSFQKDPKVVIRWIKRTEEHPRVHSFSKNQDQLENQDQDFRGRTSLFKDQISRGNASLLLTGVKSEDWGQYQCYTRTTSGSERSIINVKVKDNSIPIGSIVGVVVGGLFVVAAVTLICSWIYICIHTFIYFPLRIYYLQKRLKRTHNTREPRTVRYIPGTSEPSSPPNGENQQQDNNSHLLESHEE